MQVCKAIGASSIRDFSESPQEIQCYFRELQESEMEDGERKGGAGRAQGDCTFPNIFTGRGHRHCYTYH